MRISTTGFFDRATARMATLDARADALYGQLAENRKLVAASDNPAGWRMLAGIRQSAAADTAHAANIKLAQGLLVQTDDALGQVDTQLVRARELALQANSGLLSAEAREAIAVQLDGVVADITAIAAQRDLRGQPLFDANTPAAIPIGPDSSIQPGEAGPRVFGGPGAPDGSIDIVATLSALSAAVRGGGDMADATAQALAGIDGASAQVTNARASSGARAARLEIEGARLDEANVARETMRSTLEDVDVAATIAELQKTMTILQATQASFARLSQLSLFDQIR